MFGRTKHGLDAGNSIFPGQEETGFALRAKPRFVVIRRAIEYRLRLANSARDRVSTRVQGDTFIQLEAAFALFALSVGRVPVAVGHGGRHAFALVETEEEAARTGRADVLGQIDFAVGDTRRNQTTVLEVGVENVGRGAAQTQAVFGVPEFANVALRGDFFDLLLVGLEDRASRLGGRRSHDESLRAGQAVQVQDWLAVRTQVGDRVHAPAVHFRRNRAAFSGLVRDRFFGGSFG